ncbi:MAG TPA: M48 family metalloprotease [Frankiaceae bacterium]|nr:M48 family metalloprotease [Frankiaceae bacterium]
MQFSVYLALAAALVASYVLRPTARRLAPRAAAGVLAVGGLAAGLVWTAALSLLFAATVGRVGVVARLGHWSAALITAREPVPLAAGLVGTAVLGGGGLMVGVAFGRLVGELRGIRRLRDQAADRRDGDVAVIESASPVALALPGWRGSVVLTSSMLQALEPAEQRVLLAHERCHLYNAHWLYRLTTRLGAAVLPTLRPTVRQCDLALERWADETAADAVGDRRLTATAIAKAALATSTSPEPALTPAFISGPVVQRVEAMLEPPRASRWASLAWPTGLLGVALTAVVLAGGNLEDLFELAKHL